jgi:F420-dependent oxidoreductase-like protein
VRLATMLDYSKGFLEAAKGVADLEAAGIDVVLVAEAYGFDAVSQLGYLAAVTERLEIASGILPIYSRTPTLLAQTAAGLDALSEGRFILGLGASGPQVVEGWHGVPYDAPLERTAEIIEICHKVWRREVVTASGRYTIPLPAEQGTGLGKPLKMLTHPLRPSVPIWVAALGPKNVEQTARLAQGWLPFLFVPERAETVWGPALRAGLAARPAELGPFDIVAGGLAAVGEGLEGLRDKGRPQAALYIGGMGARGRNFYNAVVRRYGFEEEAEAIQDYYLGGRKEEAAAAVPAALLEGSSLIGSPGYVRDRLAAYEEAGVSVLLVTPVGPERRRTIETLKEWVS